MRKNFLINPFWMIMDLLIMLVLSVAPPAARAETISRNMVYNGSFTVQNAQPNLVQGWKVGGTGYDMDYLGNLDALTGDFAGAVAILGDLTLKTAAGGLTRTGQIYTFTDAKIGAAAGWGVRAGANAWLSTMAASQTSGTLIVNITGLHVGDIITRLNLIGQVESAGGAVVIDAALMKTTAVAADVSTESVASIVRPTITADTVLSSATGKGVSAVFK